VLNWTRNLLYFRWWASSPLVDVRWSHRGASPTPPPREVEPPPFHHSSWYCSWCWWLICMSSSRALRVMHWEPPKRKCSAFIGRESSIIRLHRTWARVWAPSSRVCLAQPPLPTCFDSRAPSPTPSSVPGSALQSFSPQRHPGWLCDDDLVMSSKWPHIHNVNVNRNSAQLDKEPVVLPVVGVEPPRGREVKPPRCLPDLPPGGGATAVPSFFMILLLVLVINMYVVIARVESHVLGTSKNGNVPLS